MTDLPTTRSWVATRDSAEQAARALLGLTLRRRRWWLYVTVTEVLFAALLAVSFDDRYGVASRVVWGAAYALVPTLVIAVVGLGVGYLMNRRSFGQRLREGVVLEADLGERHVVLRGPWAETRLSVDGIASVRSSGSWVFLRQVGSPVLSVWPGELFPPADLARLERSVAAKQA